VGGTPGVTTATTSFGAADFLAERRTRDGSTRYETDFRQTLLSCDTPPDY
jgi:hypothetical protein